MVEIIEQKFRIGPDAYGRPVEAMRKRLYDGKTVWEIRSQPVNQRDDGERMSGLTDANLSALADVVRLAEGGRSDG